MNKESPRFLILFNSIPYFLNYFNRENVHGSLVLRDIPFLLKVMRKISRWVKFSQVYWFGRWKKDLSSIDTVIIFAPLKELEVLNFIKKSNPDIRIIYWYWNPVFRIKRIDKKLLGGVEQWSFDPEDCKEFRLKFNTTFYFKEISIPNNKIEFDAIFVGNDKGRGDYLNELEDRLKSIGLSSYFYVVPDKNEANKNQVKKIPYEQYLDLVSRSKAIIDIVPEGQSGLTVRPMESIFLKKKLITSDPTIANEDFYSPQNIFILGKDEESNLKTFIDSPYVPVPLSVIDHYDLSEWLQRFNRE